jgi:hypothetical protein
MIKYDEATMSSQLAAIINHTINSMPAKIRGQT